MFRLGTLVVFVIMLIWAVLSEARPAIIQSKTHRMQSAAGMSQVDDGLFVGNWDDSINEQDLAYYGIKGVLTLNYENQHTAADERMYKRRGIAHKTIIIEDSPAANIAQHVPAALAFIKGHQPTLVHCTMGISRSSSIAIAYIMNKRRCGYDVALARARRRRPIINPNHAFERQLRGLERP
jgi:protein-tyrosine phosphatase